jgi:acetyl-CoA carboxylase carboxyl transferase beta subunit
MSFLKFLNPKNELEPGGRQTAPIAPDENEPSKPCPNCRRQIPETRLWANFNCCPHCGWHFRLNARQRINFVVDPGSFDELFADYRSDDPLGFPGYRKKLELSRKVSGEIEAVICGTARIKEQPCAIFVMEPNFMMGSMGTAVGEKLTRLFEFATEKRLPVVGYTVSGGARMQEGILSLMQMAKTSAAVNRLGDAGLVYIVVLTDPTTGGVTASFAMEGDIIIAEPRATIGFAGARVIEQTTRRKLPAGFQSAEFLLERGFVDAIVPREKQRQVIGTMLKIHKGGNQDG